AKVYRENNNDPVLNAASEQMNPGIMKKYYKKQEIERKAKQAEKERQRKEKEKKRKQQIIDEQEEEENYQRKQNKQSLIDRINQIFNRAQQSEFPTQEAFPETAPQDLPEGWQSGDFSALDANAVEGSLAEVAPEATEM